MPYESSNKQPIPIKIQCMPGIQRDGTRYHARALIDGQWIRFQNDWPQKMGGYTSRLLGNKTIVGSLYSVQRSSSSDIYMGRNDKLSYFNITNKNAIGTEIDRTPNQVNPGTGKPYFQADPNGQNLWCFTNLSYTITKSSINVNDIIVQYGHNRSSISSQLSTDPLSPDGFLFYGGVDSNDALQVVVDTNRTSATYPAGIPIQASGGVIALAPIVIAYGDDGALQWCFPNKITKWSTGIGDDLVVNKLFLDGTKVVAAALYQGSVLFWTLQNLWRVTWIPSQDTSAAGTLSASIVMQGTSILSAQSIVSYQNYLFWVGQKQFYMFNGTIQRIENKMCQNYFFDNLDEDNLGKICGFANPNFDEMTWLFPVSGVNNGENSRFVTYNLSKASWTSGELTRSAAVGPTTNYGWPILTSSQIEVSQVGSSVIESYPIWQHEVGFNKVLQGAIYKIRSYIQYPIVTLFDQNPSPDTNCLIESVRVENDFIQKGEMICKIYNWKYANARQELATASPTVTFTEDTPFIDGIKSQGRLVSVYFESDTIDGYFAAGQSLLNIVPGDYNL